MTLKPALPLGTIPGGCFPTGPTHHSKRMAQIKYLKLTHKLRRKITIAVRSGGHEGQGAETEKSVQPHWNPLP